MISVTMKISQGVYSIIVISMVLAACGGSVESYSATPANKTGGNPPLAPSSSGPLVAKATPFGNIYGSTQSVTLLASKNDAAIYYTVDGTLPTVTSTLYTKPISISTNTTLKFIAQDSAGNITKVVTENYTIDTVSFIANDFPGAASYPDAQYVTLSGNKPNSILYYTTDGSTPSVNSKIYTNPISTGINKSTTIKYFGRDMAGNESAVSTSIYTIGNTLTDIKIENTGALQTNVPITFGQVFAVGDLPAGTSVAGTLSNGASIPLQVNVKATHADGSVRHAIISAVLPNLASGQTETIAFSNAAMATTTPISPSAILAAGFTARIEVDLGSETYSASADTLLAGSNIQWLAGPIANEWVVSAPLKTASGIVHPHLAARFAIRSFSGNNKTKVDVTVENDRTFTPGAQNFTYDARIYVGGSLVDTITALEHYHHARWHKSFWWNTSTPSINIKHNIDYLIATKAVPNYDRSVVPAESALAGLASNMVGKVGPMKVGLVLPYMPATGGRADIGPLPGWYALYLLSMDKRAKQAMLDMADGSGSWPIHYRDETSPSNTNTYDMPVRIDKTGTDTASNTPYKDISLNSNLNSSGPLPVPRCVNNSATLCVTPLTPEAAHEPSLVYLPYLVTGDYYYLEELQFWVAWNFLGTSAYYHDYEKGLVRWDQIRAQAWDLRTLAQAAYITPNNHPLKAYFGTILANNLNSYNSIYTNSNPNQLGIIDGKGLSLSGTTEFNPIHYDTLQGVNTGIGPWQDDFFTWSIGYLVELGFADAQPLLAWKSKFPVGRMTDPSYCWIVGAIYGLAVRPNDTAPLYNTLAEAYNATFQNFVGIDGSKFVDTACGSQAQADWLTANSGNSVTGSGSFQAGEMTGYSYSTDGYPSNMQPAIAAAAMSGIVNAKAAWIKFANRSNKPNYSSDPQFAIMPRN